MNASHVPQQQREAILDLFIWTMYADRHLALPENDSLDEMAGDMEWSAVTPVSQYMNHSFARIREVLDDPEKSDQLLDDIHRRLEGDHMRQTAYEMCHDLAHVDGQFADREQDFLNRVRTRFALA